MNDQVPVQMPDFVPSPMFHQDYYLFQENHQFIKNWLTRKNHLSGEKIFFSMSEFSFVEIKSDSHFFVAKSQCEKTWPLVFGKYNYPVNFSDLESGALIHPIA